MKIYIASSWKNQHAVEMLTKLLRDRGHQVVSFVENNYGEGHNHVTKKFDFETWVNSPDADQSFKFDTDGATKSDLVIYLSPSGKDAAAEVGAAWASGTIILGLYAKGEDFGLMRKMITFWYDRYEDLLVQVDELHDHWKDRFFKLGSPKNVGQLRSLLEKYPDDIALEWRNQPIQSLMKIVDVDGSFLLAWQ